jgi:nucleoside diphosphate kinase
MRIANDHQQSVGTSDGNVETFRVAEEAKCVTQIDAYKRVLRSYLQKTESSNSSTSTVQTDFEIPAGKLRLTAAASFSSKARLIQFGKDRMT